MTRSRILTGSVAALALALSLSTGPANAGEPNPDDFVISLDARFFQGQAVPAASVPPGIRTITYAQYVTRQRNAGLEVRSFAALLPSTVTWSIGVYR